MIRPFFCLLMLVLSSYSFAQIDLGGVTISYEQLKQIEAALPRTTEDKHFVHWTNKATGMRWVSQGHVNEGEVNFYNRPTGDRQVYGPGIYLAEKPTSSKHFGEVPVSFTVKKGTPIYKQDVVQKIIGKSLSANQASKLGEHIPLLRHATDDWFVINHAEHTQKVVYARTVFPEAKVYVSDFNNWSQYKIPSDFKELVQAGNQDAIYLKNVLETSDYMDGISFARAMKVNPGQPWGEFEPQNFPQYQSAVAEISEKLKSFQSRGMNGLEQTMLEVQTIFSGKRDIRDLTETLRTEGIRAGGDEAGKTFLATDAQLKTMQSNPYIEVVSTPKGKEHLVHYFYPDVFHYKKLKGKISDALYDKLSGMNPDELMNNHDLRRNLNRQLIDELMNDFIKRMRAGKANWVDLISIHPFEDMNGRTSRMMQEIFDNGQNHFILGDIDILLPLEEQKAYWVKSSQAQANLQVEFIDEYLMARTQHRMPDYLKTGALQEYVDNAFPHPMKIDLNNHATLEQIRNRQWVPMMSEGKIAALKDLDLKLKDPKTAQKSLETLVSLSYPQTMNHYTSSEKGMILSMMEKQMKDIKVPVNQTIWLYSNYAKTYEALDAADKGSLSSPFKVRMGTIEKYKQVIRASTQPAELDGAFSAIKQVETDPLKIINHLLSTINEKSAAATKERVSGYLMQIINNGPTQASRFKSADPALQRRSLMTLQSVIEKSINIGNKDMGTALLKNYGELYKLADKTVVARMPDADKLRMWTKNGGFSSCSLLEMLAKLGP